MKRPEQTERLLVYLTMEEKEALRYLATKMDCFYNKTPSVSSLIRLIAQGRITLSR